MAPIVPRDVKWFVSERAVADLAEVRAGFGDRYNASVAALRETLCAFFSSDGDCSRKHGTVISPVGGVPNGGKLLKVRWGALGAAGAAGCA